MPSILPMVAAPENLPAPSPSSPPRSAFSVFSTESDKTPTVDVPLSVINRILPSELDEIKVAQFMEDIQVSRAWPASSCHRQTLTTAYPRALAGGRQLYADGNPPCRLAGRSTLLLCSGRMSSVGADVEWRREGTCRTHLTLFTPRSQVRGSQATRQRNASREGHQRPSICPSTLSGRGVPILKKVGEGRQTWL